MMLVVQTAEEMLYVPGCEVASIMPTYPDRWRVVLHDGQVGHLHGEVPTGPWVRLGSGWANPAWLHQDGDAWIDPAGFRYPYERLAEPPAEEPEDERVPAGLLLVERREGKWFWRTDSGESPCDLTTKQLRVVIPDLVEVKVGLFLYLPRLKRFGSGWLELDQGMRLSVSFCSSASRLAARLGVDSLATQDSSVPWKLWRLRDFSYDLACADPERIRADLPEARVFAEHLMWQEVVGFERGESGRSWKDAKGFYRYLKQAGKRCGYSYAKTDWNVLSKEMTLRREILTLRQLGI